MVLKYLYIFAYKLYSPLYESLGWVKLPCIANMIRMPLNFQVDPSSGIREVDFSNESDIALMRALHGACLFPNVGLFFIIICISISLPYLRLRAHFQDQLMLTGRVGVLQMVIPGEEYVESSFQPRKAPRSPLADRSLS